MVTVSDSNVCVRKFDASIIYSLIKKHGITHMYGAPIVLNMLSSSPKIKPLENPVKILSAGAPPPAAVLSRTKLLGFIVSHDYGEGLWSLQYQNLISSLSNN
ncbi:hypothetical protein J1N35_026627 [Gossypium stocksii]|uniref:AMP-dependent synthetase/ligase domain-containing protein n=1 Tax=Gossypium stocksii TaxID=47602 RepID=A0A9D3ZYZ6_9ROSI|nr:hypothetical protein J1N35_026627 [Gossypium stocksii]